MKTMPVEEHVRGVVKDLLRTRGVAHSGMVVDLNGTKKIPLKGLKYRLSVQVGSHAFVPIYLRCSYVIFTYTMYYIVTRHHRLLPRMTQWSRRSAAPVSCTRSSLRRRAASRRAARPASSTRVWHRSLWATPTWIPGPTRCW